MSPASVLWKLAPAAYRSAHQVSDDLYDPPAARQARSRAVGPEAPERRSREAPASGHGVPGPFVASAAATDLVVFQDDTFSVPVANRSNQRPEPGLSVNDPVIFATGNHYAQLSTDGGHTFTFIDPAVAFVPAKAGFCCEQTTLYVPSRDLLVWLLQYASDASGNVLRLAVSRGQSNQATQVWAYADLTPQGLGAGFPAGFILNFTDLGYSDNALYLTGNVFASSAPGAAFVASVVVRFSLDSLAASVFVNADVFTLTDVGDLKPAVGSGNTMYFLTHPAASAVRLLTLPETADFLSWTDVDVTSYVNGAGAKAFCPDPNGVNACGSSDDRVSAAWRSAARSEIGVMWNAAQNGSYPLPYTQVAILRESDGGLLDEAFLSSPDVALQYASAAVNSRGDTAGTLCFAGPRTFLGTALWIRDDANGYSLSPLESEIILPGNRSPTADQWGRFFTTRQHSRLTNLWATIAVAVTQEAGGAEPHFVLFGRARDGPTPSSPVANFTFSLANPVAGQTVSFRDLSLGTSDSWSWDFGDGRSSVLENPIHSFSAVSTFDVTLTVTSSSGSSALTKKVTVLPAGPRAPSIGLSATGAARDPLFNAYDGIVGQPITLTASETEADAWSWDFGDGTSASGRTVTKTYGTSGTMLAHLTVYGDGIHTQVGPLIGSITIAVASPLRPAPGGGSTIRGAPIDRTSGIHIGAVGQAITFEADETNANRYLWFFGDNTSASGKSVTKTFDRAGVWTVKLVVYGDGVTTAIGPTVATIVIDVRPCTHCARVVPPR